MKKTAKQRLCWNCEGSVAMTDETCPFCGVSVVPATLDDGSNAGFIPPYQMGGVENRVPLSPYAAHSVEEPAEAEKTLLKYEEPEPAFA